MPRDDAPPEIQDHLEAIAERVHDAWMRQRIADGWTYGPERNDDRKTHPSLVPFEELSDDEQEFDRITVIETVQALLDLGFRIEKP